MQKIMFNNQYGLTQDVLDEIKEDTRRICSIQPPYKNYDIAFPVFDGDEPEKHPLYGAFCWVNKDNPEEHTDWIKPQFKIGEIVAIAQSYKDAGLNPNTLLPTVNGNMIPAYNHKGWNNKMFVSASLMPRKIQIKNIRLQRLQDISDEDCLKEGIKKIVSDDGTLRYYVKDGYGRTLYATYSPQRAYSFLIDRISGKGTWGSNPYVWAYSFKLIK